LSRIWNKLARTAGSCGASGGASCCGELRGELLRGAAGRAAATGSCGGAPGLLAAGVGEERAAGQPATFAGEERAAGQPATDAGGGAAGRPLGGAVGARVQGEE
jgi:hypothetical protein